MSVRVTDLQVKSDRGHKDSGTSFPAPAATPTLFYAHKFMDEIVGTASHVTGLNLWNE